MKDLAIIQGSPQQEEDPDTLMASTATLRVLYRLVFVLAHELNTYKSVIKSYLVGASDWL